MPKKSRTDWKLKRASELDRTAQDLLTEVRAACHPRLLPYSFLVLFRPEGAARGVNVVLASAAAASARERLLTGLQGFVIISWAWWQTASDRDKAAVMDHELAHFEPTEGGGLRVVDHDVQDFLAVIKRRGAYREILERLFEEAVAQQPPLPSLALPDTWGEDGEGAPIVEEVAVASGVGG